MISGNSEYPVLKVIMSSDEFHCRKTDATIGVIWVLTPSYSNVTIAVKKGSKTLIANNTKKKHQ